MKITFYYLICIFTVLLISCNTVRFTSKSSKGSDKPQVQEPTGANPNNTTNNNTSNTPESTSVPAKPNSEVVKDIINKCSPSETLVGVIAAFVVDNSNSNGISDCPKAEISAYSPNTSAPIYKCNDQTKREKAIVSAYEILGEVGNIKKDESSKSFIAVGSFPSKSDIYNGYVINSNWQNPSVYDKSKLQKDLIFTRNPIGQTPYHAGLSAAYNLFKTVSKSTTKEKVVFFITDGFPTDKDPQKILSIASSLKSLGVKIHTVFVIDTKTRTQQLSNHKLELLSQGYSEASVNLLLGLGGQKSVLEQISTEMIDIDNYGALEATIQNLIKKYVTCK